MIEIHKKSQTCSFETIWNQMCSIVHKSKSIDHMYIKKKFFEPSGKVTLVKSLSLGLIIVLAMQEDNSEKQST